jgi:glycerol-3-phosphate dehydrogenase (NAD(P)+)
LQKIGIVGAGAWGTALAIVCRRAGREVVLWAREPEVAEAINKRHVNSTFLPEHELDPAIRATTELGAVNDSEAVLLVTPAQALRAIGSQLRLGPNVAAVVCAKGIEASSGALMSEVASEIFAGRPIGILSGPTFAQEVAQGMPTAISLACADRSTGEALATALATPSFRPYWSADLTGVALGGAVKNVLAIACGISGGRRLGNNARAALLTRGFAEMMRLGLALGAQRQTMAGLAGLGDLSLTCNGTQSRNHSFGVALGEGGSAGALLTAKPQVVEGAYTAAAVVKRAARAGVDMPISAAVDAIVNRGAAIDATIGALLARPLRAEHD